MAMAIPPPIRKYWRRRFNRRFPGESRSWLRYERTFLGSYKQYAPTASQRSAIASREKVMAEVSIRGGRVDLNHVDYTLNSDSECNRLIFDSYAHWPWNQVFSDYRNPRSGGGPKSQIATA